MLILILEIFVKFVKNNPNVKGLNIFKHESLYTVYANFTTKTKCEIPGIGFLNGFQVTLCDMKCVNLDNETVKKLGVYFSYNKNLEEVKHFCEHIAEIEIILKLWRMRQLALEERITVFISLAVSKVIRLFSLQNCIIIQLIFCIKYKKLYLVRKKGKY